MNISLSYVNLNNKYLDNGILLKQRYLIKTKENLLESLPGINNKQESFNYKGLNITFDIMEVKRVVNYSKISHLIRITRLKDGLSKTYKSIREASRFMNETFNESVSHTELNRRVKLGIEYKGYKYEKVES